VRSLTFTEIDSLWEEMAAIDPEDIPELMTIVGEQQPHVVSYLLGITDEILSDPEREIVFFMGVVMLRVIQGLGIRNKEISLETLLEKEKTNFRMLDYLAGEPDAEFTDTVGKIMDNYNQSELLRYIIDRIMEEPLNDTGIVNDHIGIMVIYLKTFIDCFDAAAQQTQ
jgi:hypothetical protein